MVSKTKKQQLKQNKTRKMNCHPKINKMKIGVIPSCFTKKKLELLKHSFNKEYPENKIKSKSEKGIYKELSEKMPQCSQEDCWLDVIKNETVRDKIKKELFAPYQPDHWRNQSDSEKNTWLSNIDILNVLKQYEETEPEFYFIPPTSIDFDLQPYITSNQCVEDKLCKFNKNDILRQNKHKVGIIFNLDKHTGPGTHWVSMFIDIKQGILLYVDSVPNDDVPKEIQVFIDRVKKQIPKLEVTINKTIHQSKNTECGMYCLHVIITMLTGKGSYTNRIKDLTTKVIPDEEMMKYRDIYFNKKM